MKLRYTYHSEHHAEPKDRWIHFLLFLGAFLLLLAAGQQWFMYFTDWHASDQEHSLWHLGLGIVYLVIGAVLAYIGYRHEHASRGATDRYVRIDETHLRWSLTQKIDEASVALADIAAIERTNIRDLRVTLKNGENVILPIFLIASEGKQEELMEAIRSTL
ncbi:hypothetical protein FUA23_13540 [Neolewinella aurantiaca]|uniref:Uncharacterized protein n=1 Tax=Neolewinella aurantiaca TaxID=2602767 RepID=A0A5C7FD87_9BACT|nr:hypothetical protein [Neolewinella aurantiaca]TXF88684.1 hypothetical protein FUA23_13540 [Neolewinella aurantiaca]